MLEEGDPGDLFAPRVVAHQPWAGAVAKAGGATSAIKPAARGFVVTDPVKASKQTISVLNKAFPNHKIHVEDVIEAADKVVVRWRFEGKHGGAILGVGACNKEVELEGINVYRFVGDRIVESWGELDLGSLIRQSAGACAKAADIVSLPVQAIG